MRHVLSLEPSLGEATALQCPRRSPMPQAAWSAPVLLIQSFQSSVSPPAEKDLPLKPLPRPAREDRHWLAYVQIGVLT